MGSYELTVRTIIGGSPTAVASPANRGRRGGSSEELAQLRRCVEFVLSLGRDSGRLKKDAAVLVLP